MHSDTGRESFETPSVPRAATDNPVSPQKPTADVLPAQDGGDMRARLDRVLLSDIGINILLTRLKQSLSSARDFSTFLKERANLEKQHSYGITRLTRGTHDLIGRPETRQGSFALNYQEIGMIHDRMARNGEDFAQSLLAMSDELQELTAYCERGRKQWKHTGLEAEHRAQDADSALDKAKQRYYNAAEQYDRVRTGERQGGKFGLKGPKSAAQHEESLLSKAENADQDYRSRIEFAQAQRHELLTSSRPQAVRELQNLIKECDSAVSMQIQKFAVLNEKLLLGNGLCISPLKGQDGGTGSSSRSLREVAHGINEQKDFEDFILSHSGKVGPTPTEIKYEKHPALTPMQHNQRPSVSDTFNAPPNTFGAPSRSDTGFNSMGGPLNQSSQTSGVVSNQPHQQNTYPGPPPVSTGANSAQAPLVGPLPMGGKNSLDIGRSEPFPSRNDNDPRSFSGPTQHRAGQPSYDGRESYSPNTSVNSQVTDHHGPLGSGPSHGPGKGQPPVAGSPTATGPPVPNPYGHGSRGPSLGHPNDFQTEGRGPSQSLGYQTRQPDGRGPMQGPGYQAYEPDPRGPQVGPVYQTQQAGGRDQPSSPSYQVKQAGARGPQLASQQGPGDLTRPSDTRGPQLGLGHQAQHTDSRGLQPALGTDTRGPQFGNVQPAYQADTRAPQQGPGYQSNQADTRMLPGQATTSAITGVGGAKNNSNVSPVLGGPLGGGRGSSGRPNLPPLRPVFGVPLDELFRRDGAAVPTIVYQCVQAVDLHGLDTEGIYRVSGSAQHIMELQALFDHDSSAVDFRNPAAFYNDVAAVTTLLKHFLRDLPDPLLTSAQYGQFIQAAKLEDDIVRRDSLHAIINALPDPNYATLRTLVLHLNRVAQRCSRNRMTASNLAIVFGPTLMGGHSGGSGGEIQDAGWQARVIETILNNTLEIFDDDD